MEIGKFSLIGSSATAELSLGQVMDMSVDYKRVSEKSLGKKVVEEGGERVPLIRRLGEHFPSNQVAPSQPNSPFMFGPPVVASIEHEPQIQPKLVMAIIAQSELKWIVRFLKTL